MTNSNEPTEVTREDVDDFLDYMDKYEIRLLQCFECGKDFLPSYHPELCDECFFNKIPKKQREEFFSSFF